MTERDDAPVAGPAGRALSGRVATVVGIALGLLTAVVLLAGLAFVNGPESLDTTPLGDGRGDGGAEEHEEHIEVDPLTDEPLPVQPVDEEPDGDPCGDAPEMCGSSAGATEPGAGGCGSSGMCGDIRPDDGGQEIGSDPCEGELCGDVGPGTETGGEA